MTDTSPGIRMLHRRLLLERSGEERFLMALSMNRTGRALVWASLPQGLPDAQRRRRFFRRVYGNDFGAEQRAEIEAHLAKHAGQAFVDRRRAGDA